MPIKRRNDSADGGAFIILDESIQALAHAIRGSLAENPEVTSASAQDKARLLLIKPLDRADAKQMANAVTDFAKVLVDLFPPSTEDFFARHRSFNHLRLRDDPVKAVSVSKTLDRAFWPNETTRSECKKALGADPLRVASFNDDLLVLFLEHYLPSPLMEVVDDLVSTHSKIYRVSARHFTLLRKFTGAFGTFVPTRMTVPGDERSSVWIEKAHSKMLELFQVIEAEAVAHRPTFIALDIDDARKLTANLNGEHTPLKISELRTFVSLALLQSKKWFSVDEFSELYFGETAGDTQKRFNTCVTRIPTLKISTGGKGQTGKRRVVGTIFDGIEGRESAFREFLSGYYDSAVKKSRASKST